MTTNMAVLQLVKYISVGGVSAALETALFWWNLHGLHLVWVAANSLAIIIATLFNFFLNRLWSFQSRGPLPRQLALYLTLFFFNLMMSNLIIYVLADLEHLEILIAKLISIALIVCWNFVIYKVVIFR